MTPPEPLVSVGIPAYERPDGLARTLACIRAQTHQRLEILVSDNASPDPRVRETAERAAREDARVRFHRQETNRGAVRNFNWLLEQATGDYFMWAADDDAWEPFFVARCLEPFAAGEPSGLSAVGMEAQYVAPPEPCGERADGDGQGSIPRESRHEFFPEGVPFYRFASNDPVERMRFVLRHNYGNLFYSLYRREALFLDGESVFRRLALRSLNEIPVFLWIARAGNWRILPGVGLYKTTTPDTYAHARWEKQGGALPETSAAGGGHFRWMAGDVRRYHTSALGDVLRSLRRMGLGRAAALRLSAEACGLMARHYGYYLFRRRSPAFPAEV